MPFAFVPGTTRFALAGPVAPSSAVVAPGTLGKPVGSVSQIRPQSVSVCPTALPRLPAGVDAGAATDGPADWTGAGERVAEDPLDPQAATRTASAAATATAASHRHAWAMAAGRIDRITAAS